MSDIAMPRLSDSMEEGTILKWLKADGDEVAKGEELVEIETDKANMTYEADTAGTLEIVAQEGDTLPVGEPIARIGAGGGAAPPADEESQEDDGPEEARETEDTEETPEAEEAATERVAEEPAEEQAPAAEEGSNGRVKASPVARRMARDLGLELSTVQGSGPGGRIVKADVEAASRGGGGGGETAAPEPAEAEAPAAEPAAPEPEPARAASAAPQPVASGDGSGGAKGEVSHQEPTRLQQVVARRMAESKATAPEFVLHAEIEMDAAIEIRTRLKELALSSERPVPSVNNFIVKACALALREFPKANGAYRDGRFELHGRVNVGIAVAGQDALVVPTIVDADRKTLGEIARDARTLAERVRAGAVTPPELSGGTFTVSNLGMYGMRAIVPVINPPQAAILGVGAMTERPVVRDGEVVVRQMMDVTLVCDHRILYGADAAQFLSRIRELLEQPLTMAL
jgi:pyruvate dehydrogenase E2 component (dihydrolipoamide acetyltransferase)